MIVAAKVKLYPTAKQRALLEKHFGSGRFGPSLKLCSNSGGLKTGLKLSGRVYRCDICGLAIDRDYTASKNIRRMGLIKVGPVRPEFTPVEIATSGPYEICPYGRMSAFETGSSEGSAEGSSLARQWAICAGY